MMDIKQFDTPVLLIAFNRPETTYHIFEQIKRVRPSRLYIFQDALRNEDDRETSDVCKRLLDESQINWKCHVERWSPESNLGLAVGITSAITWAFETCERLIILEDDCLPHPSFFTYAQHMLDKYENNYRIMHISGTAIQQPREMPAGDHFFSRIGHVSGWATWKRAWAKYDFWMEGFPEMVKERKLQKLFGDANLAKYWQQQFEDVYARQKKHTWTFQWQYSMFENYGLAVVPNVNLISNLGVETPTFNSGLDTYFKETKAWKSMETTAHLTLDSWFEAHMKNGSSYRKPSVMLQFASWVRELFGANQLRSQIPF
jgi:hypothetical protein